VGAETQKPMALSNFVPPADRKAAAKAMAKPAPCCDLKGGDSSPTPGGFMGYI